MGNRNGTAPGRRRARGGRHGQGTHGGHRRRARRGRWSRVWVVGAVLAVVGAAVAVGGIVSGGSPRAGGGRPGVGASGAAADPLAARQFDVAPGGTSASQQAPEHPIPSPSASSTASAPSTADATPAASPTPTAQPTSARPSATTRTPTTAAPHTNPPATGPASTFAAEVLRLTNVERAKAGCGPLTDNARLDAAAKGLSDDMAARNFFDHTDPDGHDPGDRITAAGYNWSSYGENIARGQQTPAAVMDAWMNSPGHRANILRCSYTELGVGINTSPGGPWWTQDFGAPA
ncbi:CAP domain-containing protein [Yinghuangia seranimata]|uniref:CAP domain-containing protein n=1 Tax=Yinghuangia seranimata TaxID=408067 RepID=UPI00248C3790|nr:CAP domain-containing protein [Yinghuangia seranimata]MDI2131291.1 CAP domain-containing protein [Yinghuangia seranimata]